MKYDLTIIIPVYNEEETINEMLDELVDTKELKQYMIQYIVVDDGSTDGTSKKLEQSRFRSDKRFLFLCSEKNQGKGSVIRIALPHAEGEYTIIQDADLEYRPADMGHLLEKAQREKLEAVYGSRNLKKENLRGAPFFYWGGRAVTWIANILFGQRLTDEPTCYKLVKTSTLISLPLICKRFEFCQEVTALLSLRKIKIKEFPISYVPRSVEQGKKIRFFDGLKGVWTLVRVRCAVWNTRSLFFCIFFTTLVFYALTWHARFGGYESETARSALALLQGGYDVKRAGIGAVMMYLPFIMVFKFFGFSDQNFWYLSSVPIVYSSLISACVFVCVWHLTKKKSQALFVSFLVGVASPLWPYTNIGMEYQTTLALLLLLIAFVMWSQKIEKPFWLGLSFAFCVLVKSYGVIFFIPLAVSTLVELKKQHRTDYLKNIRWLSLLVGPGICAVLFFCISNILTHGRIGGGYSLLHEFQIATWWEGMYGIFFSAGKSIFLYSPLLLITCFYWKRFFKDYFSVALFIALGFGVLFFITAPFSYWSDETWGVRKLIPIMPLLLFPLIAFCNQNRSRFFLCIFTLTFCIALYIQFIGSIYGYGTYLAVLKRANSDSLQTMRFIPQTSHVAINHQLVMSFLTMSDHTLTYVETSWFRWLEPGQKDVIFANANVNLSQFHTPRIFWFSPIKPIKTLLFLGDFIIAIFFFGVWFFSYRTHVELEKNSKILS